MSRRAGSTRSASTSTGTGARTTSPALPDFDAYYDDLRTAKQLPTTSQPSIGDFLAVYEPLLEQGREIVSIHLSGAISGTFASAEQAREQLLGRGGERIQVIDSQSACGGRASSCWRRTRPPRAGWARTRSSRTLARRAAR